VKARDKKGKTYIIEMQVAEPKEELEAYDYAAMREQDERGKVELAEKRADKKAKNEVARKMKQKGLPNKDISDFQV
jgi:hypothetical protein